MKLITEMTDDVECLIEEKKDEKEYFIKGIFMQAEQKNRNGRLYPIDHIAPAIKQYIKEYVDKNRALGELNHPSGPTVNLDKVCHKINELYTDGNNFIGKAKILNTPSGKIVKNLIEGDVKLGVSSRGMGSLKKLSSGINEVQKDFIISAVDIVADPSAPDAFVDGILEGKEWIWDNGILKEQQINEYKKQIKKVSKRRLEETTLNAFKDFLSNL
jgi:hypothetical protein